MANITSSTFLDSITFISTTTYALRDANSNVLFSSSFIKPPLISEFQIYDNINSVQTTNTTFKSTIAISTNINDNSISSNQTLFRFKTSVFDASISSNQIISIGKFELTDSSDSLNQIIFKQKIQIENTSQSNQNIAFSFLFVEIIEPIDGIAIKNQQNNISVGEQLEKLLDIDGVAIKNQQNDILVGELEFIKNLVASIEPAVDQSGFGTQFMIINQYETPLNVNALSTRVKNFPTIIDENNANDYGLIQDLQGEWPVFKNKDIIWYGRLGTYPAFVDPNAKEKYQSRIFSSEQEFYESKYGQSYDKVYPVALNASGTIDFNDVSSFYSGNLRVATPVKAVSITKNSIALPMTKTADVPGIIDDQKLFTIKRSYMYGESIGGRNLFDVSNGRSYVGGVVGGKKLNENFVYKNLSFENYDVPDKISPYILMPEDELMLACIVQPAPYDPTDYIPDLSRDDEKYFEQPSIEFNIPKFKTRITGPGRVILYGSYVRDSLPLSPESALPLTSLAIHEDVKGSSYLYDAAYCSDQFQLEPRSSLRRSYLDRLFAGNIQDPNNPNKFPLPLGLKDPSLYKDVPSRSIAGLSVDGQTKNSWGLQRFVKLFNDKETYYDSHVPQIRNVLDYFGFIDPEVVINLTNPEQKFDILYFFPFNLPLSQNTRSDDFLDAAKSNDPSLLALQKYEINVDTTPSTDSLLVVSKEQMTAKLSLQLIFGIGPNLGLPAFNFEGDIINNLRGYRYGLKGLYPEARSAFFRSDRYGQCRDILESSQYSIFYI
jgi:hypothetical protein